MKIVLDGWRLGLRFSACHFIVDHAKCGRLHGHTYALHIAIEGDRSEKHGFVVDFIEVKNLVRGLLEKVDHRVLLPGMNDRVQIKTGDEEVEVTVHGKRYVLPASDVVLLPIRSLSAEDLAGYFLEEIKGALAGYDNITAIEVGVDEGFGQGVRVSEDL